MAVKIRLGERDVDLLRELKRWPMTTSQVGLLHGFPSSKKSAERLCLLHRAGLLTRTPHFQASNQGKAEFAYGRKRLDQRTLVHSIGIAEVRVQSALWLRTTDWSWAFFYTHEVPTTGGIIPDATLMLRRAEKAGLFFLEIDNGTEPVTSTLGYSLAKKLALYAAYFDSEGYAQDFAFAGKFLGFRVCLIVPPGRQPHVQQLVAQEGHDFVLCTTPDLPEKGFGRPVWRTHENVLVDLLGRGELVGDLVGEKVEPSLPILPIPNLIAYNDFASVLNPENPTVTKDGSKNEEDGHAGQL